ncbi:MAG TPA: FAD-dependent oxidoreductase [Streptosporangiaceae bacterium]|jgi:uncharacterized protein with NAD-binding domain and iron-sulfur cluster
MSPRVVVIGGGLAGVSAAIELQEAGADVILLEARPWLGGATCSFARGGLAIDNGQHVFLRCCTAYRAFLARLGVTGSVQLQDRFDVSVLRPGSRARLSRSGLPSPLHLARSLAGYSFLPLADRLRAGRAVLGMRLADPASPALDRARLGDWLSARGQREQARRKLWDLFIVSTLNIAGDDASTALAAKVIKTALLGDRDAADIGVPSIPLGELHGQAAASLLHRLGADVRLSTKATAVQQRPGGGFLVHAAAAADRARAAGSPAAGPAGDDGADSHEAAADDGAAGRPDEAGATVLQADGVILAVPSWAAPRLVPAELSEPAAAWPGLGVSPIVNVHVIYDRRVTRLPFAAAVDSPVQWVFDKTRQAGLQSGQYLAVSLSAADMYVDVPVARMRELFLPALQELFPGASGAQVTDFFVTRERRATFRQEPGSAALRPAAATELPGLALAGAWTDTGWPDTMEGAVRSGVTAAAEMRRVLTALSPADADRAWSAGGRFLPGPPGQAAPNEPGPARPAGRTEGGQAAPAGYRPAAGRAGTVPQDAETTAGAAS